MGRYNENSALGKQLVDIANDYFGYYGDSLKDYQTVNIYVYDQNIIKNILKEFKFKDKGNIYKYPQLADCRPQTIEGYDLPDKFELLQRIAISKKMKSIVYYSADMYSIQCMFIVDIKYIQKFIKKIKVLLKRDSGMNIFKSSDFKCKDINEFIEIVDSVDDKTKIVNVVKKKVPNEKLVFDEKSTITEVMQDISTFFKKKTVTLYEKLSLPYKRGIILYGDPGNGKSAMIREVIRTVPDIPKIVVNCNTNVFVKVLQSLMRALDNKKAIILIEDLDSMITPYNKSAFLNILDGVDMTSGFYFIGTTNYPERIDPAFMNRSGRFDRTYSIDNPSEPTRRLFFNSKDVVKLLSEYASGELNELETVELFVKNSEGLPMSNLKELITMVSYKLISDENLNIETALKESQEMLKKDKTSHKDAFNKQQMRNRKYNDFDDEEEEDNIRVTSF